MTTYAVARVRRAPASRWDGADLSVVALPLDPMLAQLVEGPFDSYAEALDACLNRLIPGRRIGQVA